MSDYIKNLIKQGEHQQLDFKFEISDSKKIARSLVAFSNTDGGKLLIGVKDNGVIAGVRSEEEFYMVEAAAQLYSKPAINFTSNKWEIEGREVLEINIQKSNKMPYYALDNDGKWLVYIRVKDQNLLANKILLKVWERKKRKKPVYIKYRDKEKLLLDYLNKNKTITLSKFCKTAKLSRKKAENILVNLIILNIIEIVFTENLTYYQLQNINPKSL